MPSRPGSPGGKSCTLCATALGEAAPSTPSTAATWCSPPSWTFPCGGEPSAELGPDSTARSSSSDTCPGRPRSSAGKQLPSGPSPALGAPIEAGPGELYWGSRVTFPAASPGKAQKLVTETGRLFDRSASRCLIARRPLGLGDDRSARHSSAPLRPASPPAKPAQRPGWRPRGRLNGASLGPAIRSLMVLDQLQGVSDDRLPDPT
jgi:hypothetical protein